MSNWIFNFRSAQTLAAIPLSGHMKILQALAGTCSVALVADVASPRSRSPNFPQEMNGIKRSNGREREKKKKKKKKNFLEGSNQARGKQPQARGKQPQYETVTRI